MQHSPHVRDLSVFPAKDLDLVHTNAHYLTQDMACHGIFMEWLCQMNEQRNAQERGRAYELWEPFSLVALMGTSVPQRTTFPICWHLSSRNTDTLGLAFEETGEERGARGHKGYRRAESSLSTRILYHRKGSISIKLLNKPGLSRLSSPKTHP